MKEIFKNLFFNIRYLINWQHRIFYIFIIFLFFYYLYYDNSNQNIDFYYILYSLGRTISNGLIISFFSLFIALIFIFLYLTKTFKFLKIVLNNIFIIPDIVYLVIFFSCFKNINLFAFFVIFSFINSYSFFNIISVDIDEIENKNFINALYSSGISHFSIAFKHLFPMLFIPLILLFLDSIVWFITIELMLSFINIIDLYSTPSLGKILFGFLKNGSFMNFYLLLGFVMIFIFEFNYIVHQIKMQFEVSVKD